MFSVTLRRLAPRSRAFIQRNNNNKNMSTSSLQMPPSIQSVRVASSDSPALAHDTLLDESGNPLVDTHMVVFKVNAFL
jgi:hypothetical protein